MNNKGINVNFRIAAVFTFLFLFSSCNAYWGASYKSKFPESEKVKYVFFFIGDGMGCPQIHSAEAYLAALESPDEDEGSVKAKLLTMSSLPVHGMATTFANNRFITGSAAAGTALACGKKTNINVIAMDPTTTIPYTSLAELAKEKGMKVGIVSSVSIDHATPAVFYAHQPARINYHEIAMELANSDFDYFAGGGFKEDETCKNCAIDTAINNGFTFAYTREELAAIKPGIRTIAINHALAGGSALYYEIDRPDDHISLAEFTKKGIELLDNPHGFFMMVEGGKIDWANHANDARASIDDTIAFDNAIKEAVDFYKKHLNETLIVVTGDHECGGMTLGFAGTNYDTAYEILAGQTKSYEEFNKDLENYFENNENAVDINEEMESLILSVFGIDFDSLSEYKQQRLEDAFDRSRTNEAAVTEEEDWLLYGSYEPFTVTLTHVLNQMAGITFTSYAHTGVPVPVLAIGTRAGLFDGFYDNTDIAKKIASAMKVQLDN